MEGMKRQTGEGKSQAKRSAGGKRGGKRTSPGSKRTWSPSLPEQHQARVAVIGGGISGLCCAQGLLEKNVACTVFDTGENGVRGRLATRRAGCRSFNGFSGKEKEGQVWDHGCQYISTRQRNPQFESVVRHWCENGIVREWKGAKVGTVDALTGKCELFGGGEQQQQCTSKKYIGTRGMRDVADHLLRFLQDSYPSTLSVSRPAWVNKLKAREEGWEVVARGESKGIFDMVVIAHNGKCANRLVKPTGAEKTFRQLKSLKLSALWCLMAEFEVVPHSSAFGERETSSSSSLLPRQQDACYITNSDVLSFVINNTSKYKTKGADATECYLFSTESFGQEHKVPQENVPPSKSDEVKDLMLQALWRIPGFSRRVKLGAWRTQLWGAALPLNKLGEPCIVEWEKRMGVCGDWLLGSGVEDAALSGFALAEKISRNIYEKDTINAGLERKLSPLSGEHVTPIGSFPS